MRHLSIIALFIILFLAIIRFFTIDLFSRDTHSQFINDKALLTITIKNPAHTFDRVLDSECLKLAQSARVESLKTLLRVSEQRIESFLKQLKNIEHYLDNRSIRMLLLKEMSIALFPPHSGGFEFTAEKLLNHCLVIIRTRKIHRLDTQLITHASDDVSIKQTIYGGHVIKKVIHPNFNLSYAFVDHYLLISVSDQVVKDGLDSYDHNREAGGATQKNDNQMWQVRSADVYTHISVTKLLKYYREHQDSSVGFYEDFTGDRLLLNEYDSIISGLWYGKDNPRTRTIVNFQIENLSEEHVALFSLKPDTVKYYERISRETALLYWTNFFRPKIILEALEELRVRQAAGQNVFNNHIDSERLNDLYRLFREEFFFLVEGVNGRQLVPIPRFMLVFGITDQQEFETRISRFLQRRAVPFVTTTHQGIAIHSWGDVLGAMDTQPTYAIYDGFFLLSSNRAQIHTFIEQQYTRSIATNNTFSKVISKTTPYNTICFIDSNQLSKMMQELVSWWPMLFLGDREKAQQTKVIIDDLINPFLNIFADHSYTGIRSYLENGILIIETETVKEPLE
ncbi:MAG: hypothetical protein D6B25_19205 [Desulfobulbaceae bacterium]|nr:MAG: hypothetical protein D6B25_19205 [Desulfobulbaceae bacterium]